MTESNESTIICPKCKNEIKLTETLAAPFIESIRKDYEEELRKKNLEYQEKDEILKSRESEITKRNKDLDEIVSNRIDEERINIAKQEEEKAKKTVSAEIEQKAKQIDDLLESINSKDLKLKEAQQTQLDLLKKQRELDDEKRELNLTIEKRVQNELSTEREKAKTEAENSIGLKLREREETIASMQKQIEELKRKSEQGSQQLQGEAQELELESLLKDRFKTDSIEPVPKGECGGDVLHRVVTGNGNICGTILWESKRTKNWSDGWLAKLREDQRNAKAEIAIIITQVLPKEIKGFGFIDNIWVTEPAIAIPVGIALRQSLIDVALARSSTEGLQTKAEIVYQYLTGPRFKHRIQAIVEAFTAMKEDLDKEKKVILKQWAKRDEQIARVMESTVGMYGDLQGIAGKTIQEIEGLEFQVLENNINVAE
jgi:hypothetical protein